MGRWQYFTVMGARKDPLDAARAMFGCRDLDGAQYNCQMLKVTGTWEDSDRLVRYHLRGSTDMDLTDMSERQAADLIGRAVELGRYGGRRLDGP